MVGGWRNGFEVSDKKSRAVAFCDWIRLTILEY